MGFAGISLGILRHDVSLMESSSHVESTATLSIFAGGRDALLPHLETMAQ